MKLDCDCGRPSGKHTRLDCGVPIPSHEEIEAELYRRLERLAALEEAARPFAEYWRNVAKFVPYDYFAEHPWGPSKDQWESLAEVLEKK